MPRLRQIFAAAALASIALLTGCRLDMHVQPKQNPLSRSDFFTDQRSERPPVEGTVARGQLHDDTYFYTGKAGNNPGDYMPFPVTKEVLQRGRERYIMPDYASQVPPEDRWKIVAYIRALQLSQNATRADVPTGQPIPSEPPPFHGQPGSGATLPVIGSETTSQTEKHK